MSTACLNFDRLSFIHILRMSVDCLEFSLFAIFAMSLLMTGSLFLSVLWVFCSMVEYNLYRGDVIVICFFLNYSVGVGG